MRANPAAFLVPILTGVRGRCFWDVTGGGEASAETGSMDLFVTKSARVAV